MFDRIKNWKEYRKPTDNRMLECIKKNQALRIKECSQCGFQSKCLRVQKTSGVCLE